MSAKTNYDNLVADRIAFEERTNQARIALEEETNRLVDSKLRYLASIGNSVLKKKLGPAWAYGTDVSFLGDLGIWLKNPNSKITNITATRIEFTNPKVTTKGTDGKFSIDRKIVHMSDREFAKALRTAIYAHKASLKQAELNNAAAAIKKIENEIEKNNKEMIRLQNLVKTQKDALAQKTEVKEAKVAK